jgi:hypothetical protein
MEKETATIEIENINGDITGTMTVNLDSVLVVEPMGYGSKRSKLDFDGGLAYFTDPGRALEIRVHRACADRIEAEVAASEANVDPAQEHSIS